jgi:hypothetical protein
MRQRGRLALFVVLVTAVVIWAVSEKGLAALPLVLLYAAPHLFSAAWRYLSRRYGLPQSAPDQAYVAQLRRWRRDRNRTGSPGRPLD